MRDVENVAIYAKFMQFYAFYNVEKNWAKKYICHLWRKNDKYQVYQVVIIAIMEGKTTLHFKVGERVKLASGHDHNAIPAYNTTVPLTEK